MLKIFEKSTIVQVFTILVVTALLWAKALADPQPMAPSGHFSPLYDLIFNLSIPPLVGVIIAMVLVVLAGFFANLVLANAGLAPRNSLLPTLLFIVAMSATATTLTPSLMAALMVIIIIDKLLLRKTSLSIMPDKIFISAALIGIATMIYFPAITLVVAYLLIAINYQLYSWREITIFFLGLLAPYFLLWSVLLFTDGLADSFVAMGAEFGTLSLSVGDVTTLQSFANGVLILSFLISLFIVWSHLGEKTATWSKNATTLMLLTATTVALIPFTQLYPVSFEFLALPFTFCLCQRFTLKPSHHNRSRSTLKDNLFDILLVIIIIAAVLC